MSSLVVNTNMSAIQTLNDLTATNNAESTAISRLSSGLQVQNAATGPAQYVVSQSLESEANGYGTAVSNAQDGVSMIQTVSGALSQISSILQTMEQLALTSANGATQTATSLAANQSEFTDLTKSINEIANTTTFGTTKLLVTTYSGTLQVGAFNTKDQQVKMTITSVTSTSLHLASGTHSVAGTAVAKTSTEYTVALGADTASLTFSVKSNGTKTTRSYQVTLGSGSQTLTAIAAKINSSVAGSVVTAAVVSTGTAGDKKLTISSNSLFTVKATSSTTTKTGGTYLDSATYGTAGTVSSSTPTSVVSIASAATAQKAVTAVQAALAKVDGVASTVGATQNELNAIVSNLTVGQQNLQAADSQLVDVNMAQEMTTFSTDQILMQSGVSMLAQAQQLPSLVLKLMGG